MANLSDHRLTALQQWLPQRGSQVTSLHAASCTSLQLQLHSGDLIKHTMLEELKQLPCSKLRDLHLQGITVQPPLLPPTAPSTLTRLVLDGITMSQQAPLLTDIDQPAQQQLEQGPWQLQQQKHIHLKQLLQELRRLTSLQQLKLRNLRPSTLVLSGMSHGQGIALQLPFEQLRDLELHDIRPQLPLLQVLQQPEQAASKLTKLVLHDFIPDKEDAGLSLQELGCLCSLQHLHLDLFFVMIKILLDGVNNQMALITTAGQHTVDISPLGALTKLQSLQLRLPPIRKLGVSVVVDGLHHLQSLTTLSLDGYCITQSDSRGIGRLTKLLALQLSCPTMDATALAGVTGLQSPKLLECICPAAGLFQLLQKLTVLTQLALTCTDNMPVVLAHGDMGHVLDVLDSGLAWLL